MKLTAMARKRDTKDHLPLDVLDWQNLTDLELNKLSQGFYLSGEYVLAEVAAKRSVPLAKARTGGNSENFAGALSQHAMCLAELGELKVAEGLLLESLEISEEVLTPRDLRMLTRRNNLAGVLNMLGRPAEARKTFREILEIAEFDLEDDHPFITNLLNNIGASYVAEARYVDAEKFLSRAVERQELSKEPDPLEQATCLTQFSGCLYNLNRLEEAERVCRNAIGLLKSNGYEEHAQLASSLNNLALILISQERFHDAKVSLDDALKIGLACYGPKGLEVATFMESLANLHLNSGRITEAISMQKEAVAITKGALGANDETLASREQTLAMFQTVL